MPTLKVLNECDANQVSVITCVGNAQHTHNCLVLVDSIRANVWHLLLIALPLCLCAAGGVVCIAVFA